MTTDDGRRIRDLIRGNDEKVLDRWVAAAADPLQGQLTPAELHSSFAELMSAALATHWPRRATDVRADAYAGARAVLAEMSRDRARRGFTPSETASAVFALKEPLFALAVDRAATPLTDIIAVSRWVDALGLLTFEQFARAREQVISEQAEQLLELTTPVVKLWEGVVAVPLIGTLDSAPHADRHGEAAADARRHRVRARDHRHHRASPPSTPRSRSTC